MLKLLNNPTKRMLVFSLFSLVFSLILVVIVGFAWFSISEKANSSLTNLIGEINAEFEFYVYLDSQRIGNDNPSLNVCSAETVDKCYLLVETEDELGVEYIYIFGNNGKKVFPGEKFSFAMKVTNSGNIDALMDIELNRLESIGFDMEINKIQRSFRYSITKIVHLYNEIESADIKEIEPLVFYNQTFLYDRDDSYLMAEMIPVNQKTSTTSTVIVFFDIYFDPTISGYDSTGQIVNNSNAFQNQSFSIKQIKMVLYNPQE